MEKLGNPTFRFDFTSYEETIKEVNNLKIRKVSQKTDIPVRIIKENIDIVSYFLYHNFNNSLSCSTFPTAMKYAEVTPIHKKDDKTDKENYRPISILPNLSKVYERLMYNQIYPYFQTIFSKFQCGFRKGFNAQHYLLAMVEKWRKTLDGGGETGTVLTDLSKGFDCTDHNLLIGKLNACGFEKQSINFMYSYLNKRKKERKLTLRSVYGKHYFQVSSRLHFRTTFINIYICDMFFETLANIDSAGYADDNNPYTYSSNIKNVLGNLQGALEKMFHGFSTNKLVANARKCHLLTSSKMPVEIHISNTSQGARGGKP